MTGKPLTPDDHDLIEHARNVLIEYYSPSRHTTGAALRTVAGDIYTGVSLKGNTAQSDMHAEPIALAKAMMDGESTFETVTAVQPATGVDQPSEGIRIVSACGVCRELLIAHEANMWIIVSRENGGRKRRLSSLLPE